MVRRFYIEPERTRKSDLSLSGREARHLKTVLRLKAGNGVVLFDGTGNEYEARVRAVKPGQVDLQIIAARSSSIQSSVKLTVAQALLKKRKMDGLIRQLTELGIHHWQPFISSRSIPRPTKTKQLIQAKRWQTIAVEALKQCRRNRPPLVSPLVAFDDVLTANEKDTKRIILWEKATEPLGNRLPASPVTNMMRILIVLGPEGGFSDAEIETAKKKGFATASLGQFILRAETAAIAATVLAMNHGGELG